MIHYILVPHGVLGQCSLSNARAWVAAHRLPFEKPLRANPIAKSIAKAMKKSPTHGMWKEEWEYTYKHAETKLLDALKAGDLKAFGKKTANLAAHKKVFEITFKDAHKIWAGSREIPAEFWQARRIDWEHCTGMSAHEAYAKIFIKTENLLEVFPPPEAFAANNIKEMCGYYIDVAALSEKERQILIGDPHKKHNAGRPSKEWDECFYLELHRRYTSVSKPPKLENLIHDLREWWRHERNEEPPSYGAMHQKIKPYLVCLKIIRNSDSQ